MKTVIQIVLILTACGLAYLIYESIETPLRFEKAKDARYEAVIDRLKDIRDVEVAYKEVHGEYTDNWDTLIDFAQTGKLPLILKIGMLTDSMINEGLNEEQAIKEGLIIRDTTFVAVKDTLLEEGFDVNLLRVIPNTDKDFNLGARVIVSGSGVKIPLFQAAAHNNTILADLKDEYGQEIINLNDKARTNKKYPGLKVGSLEQANNNAGNWE